MIALGFFNELLTGLKSQMRAWDLFIATLCVVGSRQLAMH
jgi:hypothetical protein